MSINVFDCRMVVTGLLTVEFSIQRDALGATYPVYCIVVICDAEQCLAAPHDQPLVHSWILTTRVITIF